jgi:hypothetical protein
VGAESTLTELWDGTSGSIIASQNPGSVKGLLGVTGRGDGSIAAIGFKEHSRTLTRLVLQNAGSAPKIRTPSAAVPVLATEAAATTSAGTRTIPAAVVVGSADQLLAAADEADQPRFIARHRLNPAFRRYEIL